MLGTVMTATDALQPLTTPTSQKKGWHHFKPKCQSKYSKVSEIVQVPTVAWQKKKKKRELLVQHRPTNARKG